MGETHWSGPVLELHYKQATKQLSQGTCGAIQFSGFLYVTALDVLELMLQTKLASKSQRSTCFFLPNVIKGMHYHHPAGVVGLETELRCLIHGRPVISQEPLQTTMRKGQKSFLYPEGTCFQQTDPLQSQQDFLVIKLSFSDLSHLDF